MPNLTRSAAMFTAAVLTANAGPYDASGFSTRVITVSTTGFTGTLSIQAQEDSSTGFANARLIRLDTGQDIGTGAISYTTDTSVVSYCVIGPANQLQAVMTRSAGSITASLFFSEAAEVQPLPSILKTTAGPPSPGQTGKVFNNTAPVSIASTPTLISLYTVTAGKTLYITDILISGDFTTNVEVQLKNGATVILDTFVKGDTAPLQMPGLETQLQVAGGAVLAINIPTGVAAKNITYLVCGYET